MKKYIFTTIIFFYLFYFIAEFLIFVCKIRAVHSRAAYHNNSGSMWLIKILNFYVKITYRVLTK